MNTDGQSQSLNIRIRAAVQVIGSDWFEILVSVSAACHMGNCAGFTGDQDLVQRYLDTRRKLNALT
jgi:hypothetical protein